MYEQCLAWAVLPASKGDGGDGRDCGSVPGTKDHRVGPTVQEHSTKLPRLRGRPESSLTPSLAHAWTP